MDSKNEQDYATGANSATDDFISVGTGVNTLRKVGGGIGRYGWVNTYIGADYALKNKYFFAFNMAVDGSSRFGSNVNNALKISGRSYAVMPSLGASWLVSSEKFMSKLKFVDVLKLRATISKTGNDDIGNYTAKQSYVSQNLLGVQGLVRANVANPAFQWETTTKSNLGLDLALFNERMNISVDVFTNKTDNMLAFEPLPVASGYSFAITNTGAMKTTGFDVSLGARIVNKKSFKWDIGVTVAASKNRITALPSNETITNFGGATIQTIVGAPVSGFYGYKTNGVYASDAEATADGLTKLQTDGSFAAFKGGDIKFQDVNGDKIIDDKDRQVIGNPTPNFVGGITTKLVYKRFSLDAMFTFSQGNSIYNGVRAALEAQSTTENQLQSVINRWRVPGQVTNTPRVSYGDPLGNSSFSDRWIEDGSFLRLKTITASYQLPIKPGKALRYVTLYVTGNNLLTFTKYLGFDPEFYAAETVLARGVDVGLEPQYKSIITGLRIGL
jgi:TonB-linked SusC/RagA family outer membrane protein